MQEKSTKPFLQKLDALTELPNGFSFDAAQSWNRMEEKLTGRKRKNNSALWYMAAAASLVLIVSIAYFNQQRKINPVVVKPEQTKKEQSVIADTKSNEVELNNKIKETRNNPVITKTKPLTDKNSVEVPIIVKETKQPELITQTNIPQEIKVETDLAETTVAVTPLIATPVKRKIIHINELSKESFLKEQQTLSVKDERALPEIITEEATTPAKPWYKKLKSSHRINNN